MPRDLPIGNGSLLINFDSTGQIRDIYWPFVGQAPHIAGPAPCHLRSHDPRRPAQGGATGDKIQHVTGNQPSPILSHWQVRRRREA